MTARIYADAPVSGLTLNFTTTGVTQDVFYGLVGAWHEYLIPITDTGCYVITIITAEYFTLYPVICSGLSTPDLKGLMQPFTEKLVQAVVNFTIEYSEYQGYAAGYPGLVYPDYAGNSTGIQ